MEKKLSIVIPLYNCEAYIGECIDSLTRQNFNDEYEIIIVDDGSCDDSAEIALEYSLKYSYITVLDSYNGGLPAARNKGIEFASARYITFVDSDDYVADNIYIPFINVMYEKNLMGFYFGYTSSEKMLGQPERDESGKIAVKTDNFHGSVMCWCVIYDRGVLFQNGIMFDKNMHYGEDYMFNILFECACIADPRPCGINNGKLYYYRMNENSVCHRLCAEKHQKDKPMSKKGYISTLYMADFLNKQITECNHSESAIRYLKISLSITLLGGIWYSFLCGNNPHKAWRELNGNGIKLSRDINIKNIEGTSWSLRIKSEIQYLCRYRFFFDLFSLIFKIIY